MQDINITVNKVYEDLCYWLKKATTHLIQKKGELIHLGIKHMILLVKKALKRRQSI